MSIRLLAVGTRVPGWIRTGFDEYAKRLPRSWGFELVEVAADKRAQGAAQARAREAERLLARLHSGEVLVALDEAGMNRTTEQLAGDLPKWQAMGNGLSFVIGGADGLDAAVLERADARLALSCLTFPHALVRVVLVEQLYRAHTLLSGHPYHRG